MERYYTGRITLPELSDFRYVQMFQLFHPSSLLCPVAVQVLPGPQLRPFPAIRIWETSSRFLQYQRNSSVWQVRTHLTRMDWVSRTYLTSSKYSKRPFRAN